MRQSTGTRRSLARRSSKLCRRQGISQGIHYKWSKDFVAEQTLELRLLKKSMIGDQGTHDHPAGAKPAFEPRLHVRQS